MNLTFPQPDAQLVEDRLQSLVDRFARAGWITGDNVIHPRFVSIHLTPLGKIRMRRLGDLVRPFANHILYGTGKPGILSYFRVFFALALLRNELRPPAFDRDECNCLIALVALLDFQDQERYRA